MNLKKLTRIMAFLLMIVLLLPAMPESALAATAAKKVVLEESNTLTLDLGGTYKHTIEASVYPEKASQSMVFKSAKTSVATVSKKGVITAKKVGKVKIGIRPKNVSKWTFIYLTVTDSRRPDSITTDVSSVSMDISETKTIRATASPSTASQEFTWKTSNKSVVTVSGGKLTPRGVGKATVRVTSKYNSSVYKNIKVTVSDRRIPDSIKLSQKTLTIEPTQTFQMSAQALPETAGQEFSWKTNNKNIATVSSDGLIKAKKAGTCLIRAYSKYSGKVYATLKLTVKYGATPSAIVVSPSTVSVEVGKTQQLTPVVTPESASQVLTYASNAEKIATVSSSGLITAKTTGTATVRVRSKKTSKVYTDVKVIVYDATTPKSITLNQTDLYLGAGDTITLTPDVQPKTCNQAVTWASSDTSVATVSNGKVIAKAAGTCTIGVKTQKGGLTAKCSVTVFSTTKSTVIPEKTTKTSGIKQNLAKIKALEYSAEREVDNLVKAGTISASEGTQRKLIIERAFSMYSFPWMTLKKQDYWLAANSNGGAKNFQPGIVYYGLPYTQYNRTYDVTKALLNGHWTETGNGYYLLNQNKLVSGRYVGNDCSGFVSIAQWGTGTSYSTLNTTGIASSKAYKNVSGYKNLRPGDLLVRSGVHTLLFLYYVDGNKDRAVVIEQGGGGTSTNTVNTSIQSMASVTKTYTIKRKTTFN